MSNYSYVISNCEQGYYNIHSVWDNTYKAIKLLLNQNNNYKLILYSKENGKFVMSINYVEKYKMEDYENEINNKLGVLNLSIIKELPYSSQAEIMQKRKEGRQEMMSNSQKLSEKAYEIIAEMKKEV